MTTTIPLEGLQRGRPCEGGCGTMLPIAASRQRCPACQAKQENEWLAEFDGPQRPARDPYARFLASLPEDL